MCRYLRGRALVELLVLSVLCWSSRVWSETLVEQDVDNRITVAFHVSGLELQRWLPVPWEIDAVAKGPNQGANLSISFVDRLISQDAEGKLMRGGTNRFVGLSVPVKQRQTGETAIMVIRLYTADPQYVPGPYKNSILTRIRREAALQGADLEPGIGTEVWEIEDRAGGRLDLRVDYERSVPSRAKTETKPHSSVDPDFYRIYRVDDGADVVKSVPSAIERVRSYEFRTTIQELNRLFDGSEQLISITVRPWYVRQVFLP